MFEDQIKPGMKGYGLTVMHGNKIERFDFEVIDVMKNFMPGNNAILIKCSGLGLEHSGIIAGMSGSPCYIDGKMIGAVAFGWGTSKDPIGGVQPIRQMLNIPLPANEDAGPARGALGATSRWSQSGTWADAGWKKPGWRKLLQRLEPSGPPAPLAGSAAGGSEVAEGLHPLASPLMVSGASRQTMAFLTQAFASSGLVPMSAGGTGGGSGGAAGSLGSKEIGGVAALKPDDIKLEPGAAIAIPLLSGDLDLSAIGTVTEVADGHIWAFGHAMFAEGQSDLPISTGYIYTVMPSIVQSFKMGSSFHPAGRLVTDEQTGIVGRFGKLPRMVPISIEIKSTDGTVDHTYHYEMAPHPRLAAEIIRAALMETFMAQREMPPHFTTSTVGEITFSGGYSLKIDSKGTTGNLDVFTPVMATAMLMENPFENLKIEGVKLQARVDSVDHSAMIKAAQLKSTVVAPGDEVVATVTVLPFQDEPRDMEIHFTIPKTTPDGQYTLQIGTADMAVCHEEECFPQRYDPDSVASLHDAIQRMMSFRSDRLYVRMTLEPTGVAEGGREMADLPASRTAMYLSPRHGDAAPVYDVVALDVPLEYVLTDGDQTLSITVDQNAHKRYRAAVSENRAEAPAGGRIVIHHGSSERMTGNSDPFGP
jgi:hypothetical protein